MNTMGVALLLSPVLIYLVAALVEGRRVVSASEFFLAAGKVSSFEFANSSIGYGFQIASVSIFLAWGYLYGFGALVNPLFWGVGIVVFAAFLHRMRPYLGSGKTLHGFLGERYGSRALAALASLVTIMGFLGTVVAELAWGSAVFRLLSPSPVIVGVLLTGMAVVIMVYLVRAGQLNAMRTDQVQLIFTYFGFLALGVTLVWLIADRDLNARAMSFILSTALGLCLFVMAMMIWRQLRLERHLASAARFTLTRFVRPVLLALVSIAAALLFVNMLRTWPTGASLHTAVSAPTFLNFSQGTANLLSLALLPLLWQFVDITMWQRLAAVQLPEDSGNPGSLRERLKPIRVGLHRFAFESPVTWLFAVIIGIALRHAGIGITEENIWDALGSIPVALVQSAETIGPLLGPFLAAAFGAAMVAAMLSTADSMMMGALAVFSLDLAPLAERTRPQPPTTGGSSARAIRIGRIAIVGFLVFALAIIWLQLLTSIQVLPILLGAYSAQLSLAASVLGWLLLPPQALRRGWAIASIGAGVAATAYATAVAIGNPDWQLYAPLFALGASFPVYGLGMIISLSKPSRETPP